MPGTTRERPKARAPERAQLKDFDLKSVKKDFGDLVCLWGEETGNEAEISVCFRIAEREEVVVGKVCDEQGSR